MLCMVETLIEGNLSLVQDHERQCSRSHQVCVGVREAVPYPESFFSLVGSPHLEQSALHFRAYRS